MKVNTVSQRAVLEYALILSHARSDSFDKAIIKPIIKKVS